MGAREPWDAFFHGFWHFGAAGRRGCSVVGCVGSGFSVGSLVGSENSQGLWFFILFVLCSKPFRDAKSVILRGVAQITLSSPHGEVQRDLSGVHGMDYAKVEWNAMECYATQG